MTGSREDAAALERRALALWESKQLDAAEALYTTLGEQTDPGDYRAPDFLGSRASVRAELGRHDEARADYEAALAGELAQGNPNTSPSVCVARYFLGEHALRRGEHGRALEVVDPSLNAANSLAGLLQMVSARSGYIGDEARLEEAESGAQEAPSRSPHARREG
jgi:tetratricopeptide (TPR) repeat protein